MNYKFVIFADFDEIKKSNFTIFNDTGVKIFFLHSEFVKYSEFLTQLPREKVQPYIENNKFINDGIKDKTIQVVSNENRFLEHVLVDIVLKFYKKGNVAVVVSDPTQYPRLAVFKEIYKDAGFVLGVGPFASLFDPDAPQKGDDAPMEDEKVAVVKEETDNEEEEIVIQKQDNKPAEQKEEPAPQEDDDAVFVKQTGGESKQEQKSAPQGDEEEVAINMDPQPDEQPEQKQQQKLDESEDDDAIFKKQSGDEAPKKEESQEEIATIEMPEEPAQKEVQQEESQEEAVPVEAPEEPAKEEPQEEPEDDDGVIKKEDDGSDDGSQKKPFDFKF